MPWSVLVCLLHRTVVFSKGACSFFSFCSFSFPDLHWFPPQKGENSSVLTLDCFFIWGILPLGGGGGEPGWLILECSMSVFIIHVLHQHSMEHSYSANCVEQQLATPSWPSIPLATPSWPSIPLATPSWPSYRLQFHLALGLPGPLEKLNGRVLKSIVTVVAEDMWLPWDGNAPSSCYPTTCTWELQRLMEE